MLFVYGLAAWFVFMVTGIVNGAFRVAVLETSIREQYAHLVSTLLLCAALVVEISVFLSLVGDHSSGSLLALGFLWMALTIVFEFGFGRFVAGQSWQMLLQNYDVAHGRVWILVPLVLLLTPVILS
jgi:hypothetical protein